MKRFIFILAFCVLLSFSVVVNGHKHSSSKHQVLKSSKTFVQSGIDTYRFCIPVGKAPADQHHRLTLAVAAKESFDLRFDTNLDHATHFSSSSKTKAKFLLLSQFGRTASGWSSSGNELDKSGTISGLINSRVAPKWIAAQLLASKTTDFDAAVETCKSILGTYSKSADLDHDDWKKLGDETHHKKTDKIPVLPAVLLIIGSSVGIISAVVGIVFFACGKKSEQQGTEMVPLTNEEQEENDLAIAIQNSLKDETKIVEVPQQSTPQFIFLPPQFIAPVTQNAADTPYVPMFHPRFMNYSELDQQQTHQ